MPEDIDSSHPETREALISMLRDLSPEAFAGRHVLDRVPWLFSNRSQYVEWKSGLAADLNVDPFTLLVVGSAGIGFSLSPPKSFSAFGPKSDIDVAVVSQWHFEQAWKWLRELGPARRLAKGSLELDMLNWHRRNLVFDGAIATERLLSKLPFGARWRSALGRASNREPTVGRDIKVRLYKDFESLRFYHVNNIAVLQLGQLAGQVDNRPIALPGVE